MTEHPDGFDRFVRQARRLGLEVRLEPPAADVPAEVAGHALDPDLAGLYRRHGGARVLGDGFSLHLFPHSGPEPLAAVNALLRDADNARGYPLETLLVFAQVGHQLSYLAAVPHLADAAGRQPVVYLDLHEAPWALPLASSVDGAFALLGRHLEGAGPGGASEVTFPHEAAERVRADARLLDLVRAGALDHLYGDEESAAWARAL